jgi:hypothetical protein
MSALSLDSQIHALAAGTLFCSDTSKHRNDIGTPPPISSSITALFINHIDQFLKYLIALLKT